MSGILPTTATINRLVAVYIGDGRKIVNKCLADAGSHKTFREIYELSLATDTILKGLSNKNLCPGLNAARSIVKRVPLLVGIGQSSVAETELRRFVELILWAIYFTDHPIEWMNFIGKTGVGFSQDTRRPISYAAHRELGFYLEYALELMETEPSGIGIKAVVNTKQAVKRLNAAVHAGRLAREVGTVPPHDDISDQVLRSFVKIQRLTFSSCSILLAAYRKSQFDQLNAVMRAYFDWLVGANLRREVRKGPFGLV